MELRDVYNKYKNAWNRYGHFNGRADRTEFLIFTIVNSVIIGVWFLIILGLETRIHNLGQAASPTLVLATGGISLLLFLFIIFSVIPYLAVTARRFHDMGRSAWFCILLPIATIGIPLIGLPLFILVLGLIKGQPETNQYGDPPTANRT